MKTVKDIVDFGYDHFWTDEFIDNIVETGMFSSHGSSLSDAYELFEDFEKDFPNAAVDKEELRDFLNFWIPLRIDFIAKEIIEELKFYKELHRELFVELDSIPTFDIFENQDVPVSTLGVYWSTSPYTSAQHGDHTGKVALKVKTPYHSDVVDWFGTIESRIDYLHGDQEQEIKLLKDAIIKFKIVSVNGKKQ